MLYFNANILFSKNFIIRQLSASENSWQIKWQFCQNNFSTIQWLFWVTWKRFKPFINTHVKFIYRKSTHMINLNWSFPSFLFLASRLFVQWLKTICLKIKKTNKCKSGLFFSVQFLSRRCRHNTQFSGRKI